MDTQKTNDKQSLLPQEELQSDFEQKPTYIQQLKISGNYERLLIGLATAIPIIILMVLALLTLLNIVDLFGLGLIDYLVISLLVGTGIFGMYEYLHARRLRLIDEIFPDFIRDLAESRRAGMTFTKAILFASKGNYGVLTDEIKKIAQQVSWGANVTDALVSFSKRVETLSIKRTVSLIVEASRSGGNVADTLDVASKDAREIKLLESERRISMATYVIVIYVGMFVFLAIILILLTSFIPALTGGNEPGSTAVVLGGNSVSQQEITNMFYYATLIQSLFSGVVAGVFEDSRLTSSVKHVFVMVVITWITFKLLLGV